MRILKLYGMRSAYDEDMTAGVAVAELDVDQGVGALSPSLSRLSKPFATETG